MRSVPKYRTSAGHEAVELAASAGLILDDWQAQILIDSLGERRDGKWAAFEVAVVVPRQCGKGSILEARELAGLFLFGEKLILHSAQELKTSLEAFRRVKALIDGADHLRRLVKRFDNTNGAEAVELRNGARLRFVSRSKNSGRGFSGDCVILDEAYNLSADQIEALMPTMSARPNPQIWYTSSPSLDAVSGATLLSVRARGEAGEPDLAYFDYGLPAGADLDDRANWYAANPAMPHRITEEFVARERAAMTAEGFGRERLGIWPAIAADAMIAPQQWAVLADESSTALDPVAIAVDITPMRDFASIVAYGLRADGVGHVEVIEHRPGVNWVLQRLIDLRDSHKPAAICLDAAGPAASLLLDLEKAGIVRPEDPEKPQLGDLAVPSPREYAGACGSFVDAVRQQQLRHIDQPPLAHAVAGVKTRPLGDAWAWGRRAGSVDISPLVAATLARWGFEARAHLITDDDYDVLASVF